ncbi:MAG: ATPase [Paludibacteraceae bacterium]|nr:ATPase [Paludibacteraceae bacterium]
MRLIADSGSTKTEWMLIEKGTVLKQLITKGINPFFQTEEEICEELKVALISEIASAKVEQIHFYGAGCALPERKAQVANALKGFFAEAEISVESDLLGAARALLGREKGIACILGTGSNSCFYDGENIVQNVSPLGFILGDEGSGAVLGKLFVGDCLKNQLPAALRDKFMAEYQLTPAIILDRVYKQPFPNRFLASFMPFLAAHQHEPAVYNLIYNAFVAFLRRNVMQYDYSSYPVCFTGSVAYYFTDILRKSGVESGIRILKIEKNPIKGMLNYHKSVR